MHTKSNNIRVPSNTHPSRLHEDEDFFSAHCTPVSRPQSIRSTIQSFAGSYSRASVLYVADNISIHQPEEDEEQLFKTMTSDSSDKVYRTFSQTTTDHLQVTLEPLSRHTTISSILSRKLSVAAPHCDSKLYLEQKSSFIQSIFNAVNVLVGVGILALPLSFRIAGWLYGTLILVFCCLVTNYTAKVIAKCLNVNKNLDQDEHEGTYGDMGQIAFGDKGRNLISTVFIIELITIGVAMIVLLGDGIQTLFPNLDLLTTRVISFCALTPTVFISIKKLAYTSLIGIIGCVSLVVIVFYDGISKETRPGSLLDPMDTEIVPYDISNLPLSFGLIMSGFAGHAVFPSIYRDMRDPAKYNSMVDITYFITVVVYAIMSIIGYLMFGQEALQEITQNLALIDEYSQTLNRFAIWLLVLTPLAKYGLMLQPLNLSWELLLFSNPMIETWLKLEHHVESWRKQALTMIGRVCITAMLVYIALIFPGFDKVMSLLGALFSFTISIIFPLICHLQLFKHKLSITETLLNWIILIISIVMASLGTIWSFRPSEL
ncbi:transmembrane amino acid transporter protein-domain-containing protein [Thamnidium elegans]|nr:transmembrane amino acid transporter protein-domain-containing protein [Thamnidium elegans]